MTVKRASAVAIALAAALVVAACGPSNTETDAPASGSSSIDFRVGSDIGERIPEFEIRLTDDTPVTASLLLSSEKPTFLFFFGTTWTICRSELRSLIPIYPEFASSVDFYAVNIDPTDDLASLEAFGKKEGYPWPVAHSDSKVLRTLHVTQQSTKVAFGADGVIVYRARMGSGNSEEWRKIFEELAGGG